MISNRDIGDEASSTPGKAARGATVKGGATPPVSTRRKDKPAARRAVAMGIGWREKVPWRSRGVKTMTEEHEKWVDENPATFDDILNYVREFVKAVPVLIAHRIEVPELIPVSSEDMRSFIESIRDWAERVAFRLEPHVREGKPGLVNPYADLHVITYAADRWLDRFEEQCATIDSTSKEKGNGTAA